MKRISFCLVFILLTVGCYKKEKLTFEIVHFDNGDCQDCPKISIEIPKALDDKSIASAINTAVQEEIIFVLGFGEDAIAEDIQAAMADFNHEYQKMKREFSEIANFTEWEAQVNTKVVFENLRLVTLKMETYSYTGGAHGYGATTFLNFDIEKGIELDHEQLFNDLEGFLAVAELKFREQEQIPENVEINDTGFMFAGNEFHLADNLGFTNEGMLMIYNQYEVASYADGPIKLLLPYTEVNSFLNIQYRTN